MHQATSIFKILLVLGTLVASPASLAGATDKFQDVRNRMVDDEIVAAGVKNERVIQVMRTTPRHEFIPLNQRQYAYYDMALPIGEQQTISPPFVVAYMTEQLDPQPTDRILEIGTGSGYQAAVLSPLVKEVYTIEIVEPLGRKAKRTLEKLHYDNVHVRVGDGFQGWPEAAPFDKIIVTCSPEQLPQPLVDQLREGGRMIVPVGERYAQNLYLYTKQNGQLASKTLHATLFVPMTGQAETLRTVQPDPKRPTLANGGFEELIGDPPVATNWHYQRQLEIVRDDPLAPEGSNYAKFSNKDPGRGCRALQGFAVDGRHVAFLEVHFSVQGQDIHFGQDRQQWPYVVITFYDDRREPLQAERIGPFSGSFDWRRQTTRVPVPLVAREAIFRIDLLGATGKICFDAIQLRAADSP